MKSFGKHITFKRFVILLIITILALPILKGVFFTEREEHYSRGDYTYTFVRGKEYSDNKILNIPLNGMILTESTSVAGPFSFLEEGVTYGYEVKDMFRRASENDEIKGVLLTINSPGGTIPGSQAISDGIKLYKEKTGKPVYAHIRDVGASGAYWAAVSTDKIFVDNGSLVGSIGVLMGPFTYYNNTLQEGGLLGGVTTEGGIEHTYITGGEYKDTGSPYRRMTPEERDHWQNSINNEYALFVNHVSASRHLSPDFIQNTVKALPYDGIQAKQLKLIDEIGNEDTALTALVDTLGLGDDYELLTEKKKTDFLAEIFSAWTMIQKPKAQSVCSLCNTPLFLYDRTYSLYQGR